MATEQHSDREREADLQFAIPKVPRSARRDQVVKVGARLLKTKNNVSKILPEEQYVDNMKAIIQRDYFPDLKKLKVQGEYLAAMANGDESKIRELQVKYGIKKPVTATPALSDFGTPSTSYATPNVDEAFKFCNPEGDNDRLGESKPKKPKKAIDKLSLQGYLNKYTSEDNASFEELAALMNEREQKRNAWLYDAEKKHNIEHEASQKAITAAADLQMLEARDKNAPKPLLPDGWPYKARNNLLFNPNDEAALTPAELAERMRMNEIVINKEATRIKKEHAALHPKPNVMARAALHQAANFIGKVDVTGKDLGVVDADTLGVVATPVFEPGVEDTPLMTWGEIDGTPFRLDGEDDPSASLDAPVFKIPELPKRDLIAHSIHDTLSKRYNDKRKHALQAAAKAHDKTPKFGSKRAKLAMGLSPAAKHLLHNQLGIKVGSSSSSARSFGTPSSSTRSFAETPSSSLRAMVRPKPRREYPATPDHAASAKNAVADLLQLQPTLPEAAKRAPKAVDFD